MIVWRAAALIALTLAVCVWDAVGPGRPRGKPPPVRISARGLSILRAARKIPADGVLLCPSGLAEFCANRKDLLIDRFTDLRVRHFDMVFATTDHLGPVAADPVRQMLRSGELGLRFFDGYNILLERGADPSRNVLLVNDNPAKQTD